MKLVPLALLPWPPASAVSSGLKGRLAQPPTSKGEETCALAPWAAVSFAETCCAVQSVGLSMNSGLFTTTFTLRSRSGTPSLSCGRGSEVAVTAAVLGSTVIAERTTMLPRL